MPVLKMVTAKTNDLSLWDGVELNNVLMEVSTADWRTPDVGEVSGRSFRLVSASSSGTAMARVALPSAIASVYARVAMRFNTYSNTQVPVLRFMDGSTLHVSIEANPGLGTVRALRSTTTLATSSGMVFLPHSWFCLEVWVSIADSSGRCIVRVNGQNVIDFTGDTRNAGNQSVDSISFGQMAGLPAGTELYLDDAMVRDDTWCGQGGIFLLAPNASGDASNWQKSDPTKADWECVAELPPTFSQYLYTPAGAPDVDHLVNVQNLTVTPVEITAVGALARARLSAPGAGAIKPLVKSGAQTVAGSTTGLDTGERWASLYLTQNPDGSGAWSAAAIDALQVGVRSA